MKSALKNNIADVTFPQTRYQGSKLKLLDWIWECIDFLDFEKVGDIFGGTGAVSHMFKKKNKSVIFNDINEFNYQTGIALIENSKDKILDEDIKFILSDNKNRKHTVQRIFKDIYFTDEENDFIDNYVANLYGEYLNLKYKFASLLWCLFQACIIKRPFNLFHRKNLYMRMNNVDRSFGNKITWDRPFKEYISKFADELNNAVFDNGKFTKALNVDALEINYDFDLVYIDTPYISKNGTGVNYRHFYHFLEGLCKYDEWESNIDYNKKHKPLINYANPWNSKETILQAFNDILSKFHNAHLVVSYRSDGIPSIEQIVNAMQKFKKNVKLFLFGEYKYVLSKNDSTSEVLIVGYD